MVIQIIRLVISLFCSTWYLNNKYGEDLYVMKLCLFSHHKAILWPQFVVRDLRLSSEVWGCVVVWRDKLGVLVFVQLIRPGLQHTLLQFNTPLELHVPKCTERH